MKNFNTLAVAAIGVALASPTAVANKMEEVVVTSSRVPVPLRQIGTSVSVISGEEIQQRGFSTLADVLRSQPAVSVTNTGGPGKTTSLFIRGEESYRTLVLLDGINISDASGTQISPRFEHLLSAGIGRVEILRGPQGLMYGADSGGVVDITSTTPREGFGGQVSAETGKFGSQQLSGNIGAGNDVGDFALSATSMETDGFNALTTDDVLRDDDGYENTTVHGKAGWTPTQDLRIELVGHYADGENEYDGCFGPSGPANVCSDTYEMTAWRASVDYTLGAFTHDLAYAGNQTDRALQEFGVESFATRGELNSVNYLGTFTGSEALRLVYGLEVKEEKLESDSGDADRRQDSVYAEYQGDFDNSIFVTAGARYDDNEDFGSHTSYRVSGAYLFDLDAGDLKLRATYGTGFRAPSLSEIAYNNRAEVFPPASDVVLREETSAGYDVGLSWFADSGLFLEAVYFDQKVTDEIFFDLADYSGYLQGNGDSTSTGVELISEYLAFESLELSGNYTYNDTENADDQQRIRRPKHLLNLGVNWRILESRLSLGFNARGSFDAIDGATGVSLDDYTVVDINASFDVMSGIQVYGRVENLFDEDYEEVPTYNTSGTAGYVGVRWNF